MTSQAKVVTRSRSVLSGFAGLDSTTLREVVITKHLEHPNIRQILDINYEATKLEVAFEYVTMVK